MSCGDEVLNALCMCVQHMGGRGVEQAGDGVARRVHASVQYEPHPSWQEDSGDEEVHNLDSEPADAMVSTADVRNPPMQLAHKI